MAVRIPSLIYACLALFGPRALAATAELPPALKSAFIADRYRIAPAPSSGYHAWNAANLFALNFRGNSTEIEVYEKCLSLTLDAYSGQPLPKNLAAITKIAASGAKLNRVYASGLREWYSNNPRGLEQGFVVEKRRGPGALILHLAVSPDWRLRTSKDAIEITQDGVTLTASTLQAWDGRGSAVAARFSIQGQQLVLEAGGSDTLYPLTVQTLFTHPQGLAASGATRPDDSGLSEFGLSASLSADEKTAVLGTVQHRLTPDTYEGTVFVYTLDGAAWKQHQELRPSDATQGDNFGSSVALSIDGTTALIGAPDKTVGSNRWQGAAYVFTRHGDTWTQQQQLLPADGESNDVFGIATSLSDDGATALIGAAYKTIGANAQQGAAYVFTRHDASWTQQAELRAYDGAVNAQFGASATLSGDGSTALVGTVRKTLGGNPRPATRYAFQRRGDAWNPRPEQMSSDAVAPQALLAAPQKTILATVPAGAVCMVSGGPASMLAFATQPSNASVGTALASAVVVQIQDASGNLIATSNAPVTLTSTPAGVTVTVNAVSGIATFPNLLFTSPGTYTLAASSSSLATAVSHFFTITGAIASKLAFTTQPLNAIAGTAISPITVKIQDFLGNPVNSSNAVITLTSTPAGLTTTSAAVNGVATFTGLSITTPGNYSLIATSPGLNSTTSNPFSYLMLTAKVGVFRNGVAFLVDSNGNGAYDGGVDRYLPGFAGTGGPLPADLPVVGDWTGDGATKIGIYRPTSGQWFLDANNNGIYDAGDFTYSFGGVVGDIPVVGDWNGIGKSCVGVFRQGFFWVLDLNCNGSYDGVPPDAAFPFGGVSGDLPVVGAWTGASTRVGVVRKYAPAGVPQGNPFYWVLDGATANAGSAAASHQPDPARAFAFGGLTGDIFITGDWYGTATSTAGVFRAGYWVLDAALPNAPQSAHLPALTFGFGGVAGDLPIPGKW